MKETLLFILFGLFAGVSFYMLTVSGLVGPIPGLGLILATAAVLQWWVAIRLNIAWKRLSPSERAANSILGQFRWIFIVGGLFFTVDLVPHVILIMLGFDIHTVTIAHWTAHLLLFLYLMLAARLAVSMFNPQYKNIATGFVFLVGTGALVSSLMYPDTFAHIPNSVYPLLSSNPVYAFFNTLLNVASAGIFGLYLVIRGLASRDSRVRIRAVTFGLGIMSIVVMGILIHYIHSPYTPLMVDIVAIWWSMLTGISALYAARWNESRRA